MSSVKNEITTVQNLTAGFATIWGIFVANPYSNVFDRNPVLYSPMLSIVPYKVFWGIFFICVGMLSFFLNWIKKSNISALILSIIYIFFATLYLSADFGSPAWGLYGLLSLFNLLCYKWNA